MKTTNGKGTTPKSTYIKLAKAIHLADKEALSKWIDAYKEYKRSGATDKLAWATEWEHSLRGSRWDSNSAGTIRVNLSHIEWAEENIIGGAKACNSLAHIIRQKKGDKPANSDKKAQAKFVVETEAVKYSVSQLEAMLAFRKKNIGKFGK